MYLKKKFQYSDKKIMLLILWLSVLLECICAGLMVDLVKPEIELMHVKLPQHKLLQLAEKLLKIPAKTRKTLPAPMFVNEDVTVRLSEAFARAHALGMPLESYKNPFWLQKWLSRNLRESSDRTKFV